MDWTRGGGGISNRLDNWTKILIARCQRSCKLLISTVSMFLEPSAEVLVYLYIALIEEIGTNLRTKYSLRKKFCI